MGRGVGEAEVMEGEVGEGGEGEGEVERGREGVGAKGRRRDGEGSESCEGMPVSAGAEQGGRGTHLRSRRAGASSSRPRQRSQATAPSYTPGGACRSALPIPSFRNRSCEREPPAPLASSWVQLRSSLPRPIRPRLQESRAPASPRLVSMPEVAVGRSLAPRGASQRSGVS